MSMIANNTADRIEHAFVEITPTQLAIGLLVVTVLGVAMMFAQEPMLHDAMHSFRHTAGITCH